MGLFHKKSGLLPGTESTKPQRQKKPMSPAAKKRLLLTLVNTIVVFVLYYTLVALIHSSTGIKILMTVYATCLAGLLIAYVVYNRGFVYRNVTPEMLPDTLSDAQKTAILEEAEKRRTRSGWILTFLIPFLVTFIAESCVLFIWEPFLKDAFSKLFGAVILFGK